MIKQKLSYALNNWPEEVLLKGSTSFTGNFGAEKPPYTH